MPQNPIEYIIPEEEGIYSYSVILQKTYTNDMCDNNDQGAVHIGPSSKGVVVLGSNLT